MLDNAFPVLDPEVIGTLQDLADGDSGFLPDLLTTYLDQSYGNVRELRAALGSNDGRAFARVIHTLVGASLNVGAMPVAAMCRAIEADLRANGGTPQIHYVLFIERELHRVELAVIPFGACATSTLATA